MDCQGMRAFGYSFEEEIAEAKRTYGAHFIRFVLRHPVTAGIHYSFFNEFKHKTMTYTLRYISVIGSDKISHPIG